MYAIKKKFIIVCCLLTTAFYIETRSVFILIHGTWAADSDWYTSQGKENNFFDALENAVNKRESAVVSFRWSGGCGHESRVKAAQNLVKLIKTYDTHTAIFLVGHSHGGTVAALASHLLAQEKDNKHRIRALFTLGTPIMSNYLPNMSVVCYLYNLFSFEDIIQTVFGISTREYPDHKRIANLRVFINGKEPSHGELHHPLIGMWIAYIHRLFKQYLHNKGIKDHISEPSIIYFNDNKEPEYAHDSIRKELLARDRQLSVLILNSLRNSLDTGSNIPLTNR